MVCNFQFQTFATPDLLRKEGQGETDDVESFIASNEGRNVMVSKSVSAGAYILTRS